MTLFHTATHGLISKFLPLNPFGAVFMVTHRCNARCAMCNLWCDSEPDTDIDVFIELVKSPLLKEIVNVAVTGGELTLRTDLQPFYNALLTHCPKLDSINLSSNAFLPDRLLNQVNDLVKQRDAMGSKMKVIVQISLDGTPEIHDQIRGVPGGFNKVQTAVSMLNERFTKDDNVEVCHLCVIQPDNINSINEIKKFFDTLTIPVTYNMICDASYLEVNPETHPVMDQSMKDQTLAFYQSLLDDPRVDPRHKYHYTEFIGWLKAGRRQRPCGMLTQHILVDHHGQILPCMNAGEHAYPTINDDFPVEALWKGAQRKQVNATLKRYVCPNCTAACGPNTFDAILALVRQKFGSSR